MQADCQEITINAEPNTHESSVGLLLQRYYTTVSYHSITAIPIPIQLYNVHSLRH